MSDLRYNYPQQQTINPGLRNKHSRGSSHRSCVPMSTSDHTSKQSLSERFWSKVDRRGPDDCWEWQASAERGYGRFYIGEKYYKAHRMAWELTYGAVLPFICVLHKCDNPPCCNPKHLFLGTKGDNNKDRAAKGRTSRTHQNNAPKGELSLHHKVSTEAVRDFRILYAMGVQQILMADLWNIDQVTISAAIHYRTWKHTDLDLIDLRPKSRKEKEIINA